MKRRLAGIALLVLLLPGCRHAAVQQPGRLEGSSAADDPFLAIWLDSEGLHISEAPYLRIAIWNDGRILFAQDPNAWNHSLRRGRIDAVRVAELKKAVAGTGVFELQGTCYLVPDADVICTMLNLGDKRQMLYWDEVEHPHYGINTEPKPQHLEFKRCWKEVNRLATEVIPKESEPSEESFQRPPRSWYVKSPIQSK
jgi:hypothetical protein